MALNEGHPVHRLGVAELAVAQRPAAHLASSIRRYPLAMGIALADMDMPRRVAECVEHVAKALSAHLRGRSKLPGLEKLENLDSQFAAKQRHQCFGRPHERRTLRRVPLTFAIGVRLR